MAERISLLIDNQTVSVPTGTLVVDAAKLVGIDIPVFCHHPKMEPVGMCRLCLVEIGRPVRDRTSGELVKDETGAVKVAFSGKLETSCTTQVSEGMVVKTTTPEVSEARNSMLEFLLTSHPLDCPICDKGGECPLQNLTLRYGPGISQFPYDDKKHLAKELPLGELIILDRERCIQCGRCVRFQHEIVDDPVLQFRARGRSMEIQTNSDPGFDSIFSGNTTDVCPVGALTTVDFRFGARPWELRQVASICTQCPVGCNITINLRREVKSGGGATIKRIMPRQNEQVNEIWICDKGRLGHHFVESERRLTQPLIRKDGELVPASWEEAYQLVEDQLRAENTRLVTLAGGRLANEDLFNLFQLTDSKRGKPVLYSQMAGGDLTAQIGLSAGSNLGEMGKGSVILVIASDLHQEAPIWWLRVKQAVKRGATLIVAGARPTRLEKYATHVLRYKYGEEAAVLAAFSHSSDVNNENRAAVEALSAAEDGVIFYGSDGLGLTGSEHLAKACARLIVDHKFYGRKNNGLIAVWDAANTQGAWDMGFRPDRNLKGTLREADLLLVAAADPAGDDPAFAKAVQEADFVVVFELFMTVTAQLADVVFPVLAQPEREGSFTSGERRAQRFNRVIERRDGPRPDYEISGHIARLMGLNLEEKSPVLVMNQIASKVPAYSEVSYTTMSAVSPQWPIIGRADMYYGGTSYDNKEGLGVSLPSAADRGEELSLGALIFTDSPAETSAGLRLIPVTALYDRGQMLQDTIQLALRLAPQALLMHPVTAAVYGVQDGEMVQVSTSQWEMEYSILVNDSLPEDVALVTRSNGLPVQAPIFVQIQRQRKGEGD